MLNREKPQSQLSTIDRCILLLLLISAFGIRLHNITKPPLDFAPIRQYQNAHIAKGLYFETVNSISDSRKEIARLNMERMGFVLEPRIIENAAVLGYRIMGAEHLWIPRVLSAVFWIAGGLFLYLIARMLFSPGAALFSAIFYLFLPYSILASRAIQPDSLMVMMMLLSIYRVLKYDENPSLVSFFTAAIATAAAVIIKPYCIFIIFGAFFSLAVIRTGFWKAVFNKSTFGFGFTIALPAIVYYTYGLLSSEGFLGEHARGSFLPHLMLVTSFWGGWLAMIGQVTGYLAFLLAILGLLKADRGRPMALLIGLWTGYVLFGLSATYQIHTHSYYHMPFIPIVALSLCPLATQLIDRASIVKSRLPVFIVVGAVLLISISAWIIMYKPQLSTYKSELKLVAAFVGVNPEFGKFLIDDFEEEVKTAREIGEHVGHSTNTVFLTPDFGRIIAYHGELAGMPWPTSRSLYGRSVRGTKVPDIKEDFTQSYMNIFYQGKFVKYTPDFFIITALDELEKQSDLKAHLIAYFPVLAQTDKYLIFDLRSMSD